MAPPRGSFLYIGENVIKALHCCLLLCYNDRYIQGVLCPVYGDIPPEVYEERTIQTLLRKLNVAVTGSGLRAWLRDRYAWLPAAVR